jgi:hypothetical protein
MTTPLLIALVATIDATLRAWGAIWLEPIIIVHINLNSWLSYAVLVNARYAVILNRAASGDTSKL